MAAERAGQEPGGAGRRGGHVVVGVDDSDGARRALAWALVEAGRRGTRVEAVTAVQIDSVWADAYLGDVHRVERVRETARSRTQDLVDELLAGDLRRPPGADRVDVDVRVAQGSAAERLVAAVAPEDLLVVGTRGRGAIAGALLGSVALRCIMHAPCPVVVVPPGSRARPDGSEQADEEMGTVVVGVDGSPASAAAVRAAAEQAVRLGARLEAVVVHEPIGPWIDLSQSDLPGFEQMRKVSERVAGEVVEDALAGLGAGERPPYEVVAVDGRPAAVLVERARWAEMLVVGSRGHATLPGIVLVSVALRCVAKASGPVMVVHPAGQRRPSADGDSAEVGTAAGRADRATAGQA